MTPHACPDWPHLMEVAPELQFKHYTLAEAQLPPDAFVQAPGLALADMAICCDLESHVFNAAHTEPHLVDALRATHWFDLREWAAHSPGARR